MFKQSSCVPCQGGIPPLKLNEIQNYLKLIHPDWEVLEEKKIIAYHEAGHAVSG